MAFEAATRSDAADLERTGRVVGGVRARGRYSDATVLIYCESADAGATGMVAHKHCTGSVLGRRHVLTAAH